MVPKRHNVSTIALRPEPEGDPGKFSPRRFLVILIGGIFMAEVIAMIFLPIFRIFPYYLQTLIDESIMSVLISPLLYRFSLYPLLLHIEKRRQAEEQLREMALFPTLNPDAVLQVDMQGRIIKANPAADQMGLSAGLRLAELIPDLSELNLVECISSGTTQHIYETQLENRSLLWTVHGVSELKLAFLYSQDITELKRSQEMIQLLSRIVEQTADTVMVTDCDGVIEYVNPSFEKVSGYTRDEAIGMTPRFLKSGVHADRFYAELWATILKGQIFHSEITNRTRSGELVHEVKTITPLRDADGIITHFVATGKDITERKEAEQKLQRGYDELELRVQERTQELLIVNSELEEEIIQRRNAEAAIRESEEKYHNLFSNMTEGFGLHEIILDADGRPYDYRFLELNSAFEKLTGISGELALGRTVKDVLPNLESSWIEKYGRVALTGQPILFENYSVELGKWYETYCYSPRKNQFAVLFFDITERKQAEEKLLYQSALLSNVNDAIVASDNNYCLTAWNSAAEVLYGWKANEVIGRNGLEIIQTEWLETDSAEMRRLIAETGRWRGEATQKRRDGTRFPVEVSSMALYDEIGQVVGYVSVNRDITERRRAEAALRQSQDDLRRAQEVGQIGSWRLDVLNNVLTWSDENHRIFGIPLGTPLTYETFMETVHPDDREYVDTRWKAGLAGAPYDMEHRILANGQLKWVREKAYLEFDEAGGLLGGFGITQDVTERKRAEEALRESEEKYRNLFENMTEEVHFWKLVRDEMGCIQTWRLVDANPPALKSWGRNSVNEIRDKTTDEIFGPGATEHYLPIVQKIMTEGIPYSYEDYFLQLDKYFKFTSVPFGEFFITTGADITNIKKAEQELRIAHDELEQRVQERTVELAVVNRDLLKEIAERKEIERQLRIQTAAMEAAANGIMITDVRGSILWTNPALTEMTGYPEAELVGRSTRIFQSGKQDVDFYRQMWAAIADGNVWHGEMTNRRKDESLYVEEQTITPVRNDDGSVSHFIAIKQDITERKLFLAQLESSNQELAALSSAEHRQRLLAEGLVKSTLALNMSLELDSVLDHIFEQTRQIIPYITADIVLVEDRRVHIARQWGFEEHLEAMTSYETGDLSIDQFPIWESICANQSIKLSADTTRDEQWHTFPSMEWIRSYLAAPLIYNGQVIGIINLGSDRVNTFDQRMADSLMAFAASAAVAIQNARLYEAEQQNRRTAEILNTASMALSKTLDLHMIMQTVLEHVELILPFDVAFVILSESDGNYKIRAAHANGSPELGAALLGQPIDLLSNPIVASYFASHESTLITDSNEINDWQPPPELASMRSWLGIPLDSMGKILGMVVVADMKPGAFKGNRVDLVETVIRQAVVSIQNAWLFEQVRSGRQRLQELSRHLVEIQENERKYIARELHDETSQTLTSLKLGLHAIEQGAKGQDTVAEQARRLRAMTDEILTSLHRLAANLRPPSLEQLGLVEALTALVRSTGQQSGLSARFKCLGSVQRDRLSEEIESSVYRIVQESLTNIIRHAHASRADVILEWQQDQIVIIIEDDGVGINQQTVRNTGRLGLIGMQERAEMLGGTLLIESTPDVGTTLVVEIPYVDSNPHH